MTTDPPHRYRKDEPIWWDLTISKTRPSFVPKDRELQAGWVKEVNYDAGLASVAIMKEDRTEERYVVPLDLIKPRSIA